MAYKEHLDMQRNFKKVLDKSFDRETKTLYSENSKTTPLIPGLYNIKSVGSKPIFRKGPGNHDATS